MGRDPEALDKPEPDSDVESAPLTDTERAQVEASAAVIEDDRLREVVIRATVADLEWKKGIRRAETPQKPRDGL